MPKSKLTARAHGASSGTGKAAGKSNESGTSSQTGTGTSVQNGNGKAPPSQNSQEKKTSGTGTESKRENGTGKAPANGLGAEGKARSGKKEAKRELIPVTDTGRKYVSRFEYQVLSFKPRAVLYHNFATREQCDEIIELAKRKRLTPSLTSGQRPGDQQRARTSWGVFLPPRADGSGVVADLGRKVAEATMIPEDHAEDFNVLRYEIGQKYSAHFDGRQRNPGGRERGRMASFLLYLADVEEGGETCFPCENGEDADSSDDEGFEGFKVKPRKGDALLFYNFRPNGTHDETALHCSCPVIKGEKWVATKWIHETPV